MGKSGTYQACSLIYEGRIPHHYFDFESMIDVIGGG